MNQHRIVRKAHRYLGVLIGIQFIGWTISGLYFSWTNLDHIHGDHLRKSPRGVQADAAMVSPSMVLDSLRSRHGAVQLHGVQVISLVGQPLYQVGFTHYDQNADVHAAGIQYQLADAATGVLRGPLSQAEAVALARDHVAGEGRVKEVVRLEQTDGHHEYRDRPLPAYAVSFEEPACTVYISATRGTFESVRHDAWRWFDDLWMLHTMDYESRDNINNILLQIFSVFALVTVLSGFVLYGLSTRLFRRRRTADQG